MKRLLLNILLLVFTFAVVNAQVIYRVGPGQTYATIQAAYNAIPLPATSTYHITLEAGYNFAAETLPISLNNISFSNTIDSVLIYPNVSGIILATTNVPRMFSVSGDRVTIDGRVGATGNIADLQFIYAITSSTPTPIAAIDGRCQVLYCNFSSSNNLGPILKDPKWVSNCTFKDIPSIATKPKNAIISNSSITKGYIGNTFSNFTDYAISATATYSFVDTVWVYGNQFFNTVAMPAFYGLNITTATNPSARAWVIRNNYFGGTAPFCQGAKMELSATNPVFFGLVTANAGTGKCIVDSNLVTNVNLAANTATGFSFIGIGGGNNFVSDNLVGSTTNPQSITASIANTITTGTYFFTGLGTLSSKSKNNTVNGIEVTTNIRGIFNFTGMTGDTVSNQTIGGPIGGANGIVVTDSSFSSANVFFTGINTTRISDGNYVGNIRVLGNARFTGIGNATGFASSLKTNNTQLRNIEVYSTDTLVFRGISGGSLAIDNVISDIVLSNPNGGVAIIFHNDKKTGVYTNNTISNVQVAAGKFMNSEKTFGLAILLSTDNTGTFNPGVFSNNLVENISLSGNNKGFIGVSYRSTLSLTVSSFQIESNTFRNISMAAGADSVYCRIFNVAGADSIANNTIDNISLQANKLLGCEVIAVPVQGNFVLNNTIKNISLTATTADTAWFSAMVYNHSSSSATAPAIRGNTIINNRLIVPSCNRSAFTGFLITQSASPNLHIVTQNFIAGNTYLPANGTGYYYGIRTSGRVSITNNIIQLGTDAAGVVSTVGTRMYGIINTVNSNTPIHYNTLVLGSVSNSALKTYGLFSTTTIASNSNMVANTNGTTGATNQHLALALPNTFSGSFSNNLFWADTANGGVLASVDNQATYINSIVGLQAVMPGQHLASFFTAPLLNGPLLDSTASNYRPGIGSALLSNGLNMPSVPVDYFNVNRNNLPSIGAIEYGGNAMPTITVNTINCSADSSGTITITQPNADDWDVVRLVKANQVVDTMLNFAGTRQFTGLVAGNYTVELYDGNNPVRNINVSIAYLVLTPATPAIRYTPVCPGANTSIFNNTHVNGNSNYWYTQPNTNLAPDTVTLGSYRTITMPSSAVHYYLRARTLSGGIECFSPVVDSVISPLPANPAPTLVGGGDTVRSCNGLAVTINLTATGTVSWFTVPTGGTVFRTGTSYTITPTSNVVYYVQAQSTCLSPRVPIYVLPYATINNPVAANSNIKACYGETVNISFSPPAGSTTRWYSAATGGSLLYTGNTYSLQAINNTYTFFAEYFNPATGCKSSGRTQVSVAVSTSSFTGISDTVRACPGSPYTFNLVSPNSSVFKWYNVPSGGTPFFTGANFTTPAVTAPQIYYVDATLTAAPFCVSGRRKTVVTTQSLPPSPTPVETEVTVCRGLSAVLRVVAQPNTTYTWYIQGQPNPVANGNSYSYPNVQQFQTIEVYATQNGCRSAFPTLMYASVSPDAPSIVIVQNPSNPRELMCSPAVFTTYSWSYGSAILPGQNSSIIAQQAGTYSVTATDQYGCVAYSGNFIYNPVGVGSVPILEATVNPNPTQGKVSVVLAETIGTYGATCTIYKISGGIVLSQSLQVGQSIIDIDASAWAEGTYIVKVVSAKGNLVSRFVKVN